MRLNRAPTVTAKFILWFGTGELPRDTRSPLGRQNQRLTPRLSADGCATFLLFNRPQQRAQILQPLVDPSKIVVRTVFAQRVQIGVFGVL
jgi:hypothetical protein